MHEEPRAGMQFSTNHPWVGLVCEAVPRPFPDYD